MTEEFAYHNESIRIDILGLKVAIGMLLLVTLASLDTSRMVQNFTLLIMMWGSFAVYWTIRISYILYLRNEAGQLYRTWSKDGRYMILSQSLSTEVIKAKRHYTAQDDERYE